MTITRKISLYADDTLAGEGRLTAEGEIVDCPAALGDDDDASEAAYEAIEEAIDAGDESAEVAGVTYTWRIAHHYRIGTDAGSIDVDADSPDEAVAAACRHLYSGCRDVASLRAVYEPLTADGAYCWVEEDGVRVLEIGESC